jgi:hypothetical protein
VAAARAALGSGEVERARAIVRELQPARGAGLPEDAWRADAAAMPTLEELSAAAPDEAAACIRAVGRVLAEPEPGHVLSGTEALALLLAHCDAVGSRHRHAHPRAATSLSCAPVYFIGDSP